MSEKLNLACDYMQGAHPAILKRMAENNLVKSGVYGYDAFSDSAKAKIREACQAPDADIWFLVGGTQTNATVLDAVLAPYEGVISAERQETKNINFQIMKVHRNVAAKP